MHGVYIKHLWVVNILTRIATETTPHTKTAPTPPVKYHNRYLVYIMYLKRHATALYELKTALFVMGFATTIYGTILNTSCNFDTLFLISIVPKLE